MEYVKPYSAFSDKQFSRPVIEWNAAAKCIRIDEHYLFVEHNLVLEKNDERLNEFLDWKSLMPDTPMEWVHLGVDGVSAIASAFPGAGTLISFAIDMIHAVSYFIEAQYTNNQSEKWSLWVGGAITGIMGLMTAPSAKNVLGAMLKGGLKGGVGSLFKNSFKLAIKGGNIPFRIIGFFIRQCFRIGGLRKRFYNFIVKNESSSTFKLLSKIPMFRKVVNFVKTKMGRAMTELSEIFVKDLDAYKIGIRAELPKMFSKSYDQLDRSIRKTMDKKTFVKMSMDHAENMYLKPLTKESIAAGTHTLKVGSEVFSKEAIATASTAHAKHVMNRVQKEVAQEIASNPWMKAVKTNLTKEAAKRAMNQTTKEAIPYDQIAKKIIAEVPEAALKKLPLNIVKPLIKAGFIAGKEVATDYIQNPYDSINTDGNGDVDNSHIADPSSDNNTSSNDDKKEVVNSEAKKDHSYLTEQYNLKVGSVERVENIGDLSLVFQTPERTREEDDNSGSLYIEETSVFERKDLTQDMQDYDTMDELLDDLKMLGIKSEDRETLRDRDMKKWQRTSSMSTPFIESKDARYEFYFLVRERAKISLFRKNHVENIDLSNMLSRMSENGYAEINGSMYLLIKKAKNKGN
jgi:hypothetical protein